MRRRSLCSFWGGRVALGSVVCLMQLELHAGMSIPYGGDQMASVSADLAGRFSRGDRLIVVQESGDLLHIPQDVWGETATAVGRAVEAFAVIRRCDDESVGAFFAEFANRLGDDNVFAAIAMANSADVEAAKAKGRSTTRLVLTERMRVEMVAGLLGWIDFASTRNQVVRTIQHDGWRVEQRLAGLGVVGFVFEGRPNVFADACGLLRSGNTVVMRIGSDALRTAQAVMRHALEPALAGAGLPPGAVTLVESAERAAGWALFSDRRLALAVARGSGAAVAQLGAVARQSGLPVSLHGTGGAWMVTGQACDSARLDDTIRWSLDRKVCNTVNVICVLRARAEELMPVVLGAARKAARARNTSPKLHVTDAARAWVRESWWTEPVEIRRAEGISVEPAAQSLAIEELGTEWEWEDSPELSVHVVDAVDEAVELCNRWSPRFVASLISESAAEQEQFWSAVDAPFVGDGFTRWVDGQYALSTPELGLSNWQGGRLLGRSGVLSGDSVVTVRTRMFQERSDLHR